MSLKTEVQNAMKDAMKSKNQDALRALRSIKSMILLAETEAGAGDELSEAAEMQLLTKAAKQRRESAEVYKEQGRDDLAGPELAELAIIEAFLPKQLSDEEVETEVKKIIEEVGASSMRDMGKVMGKATQSLAGKADSKKISTLVKAILSGN